MVPMRDLAHHLEHLLVRLGPRVGVIDPAEPWHFLDQPLRISGPRDRACRVGEEVHFDQRVAHRIGNTLAPIANIYRPHPARHRIQKLPPGGVPDPHALALDHDPGIDGFKWFMLDQMMPQMGAVSLDYVRNIIGRHRNVHGAGILQFFGA